jgi:CheY-like chemotaxis protein
VRQILGDVLASQGAAVGTADTGEAAVAEALRADYDLIIMDLEMPVMDGFAAASKLRLAGFSRPLVAVTANALADHRASLQAGFNAHLVKPIDQRKLVATIQDVLARSRS